MLEIDGRSNGVNDLKLLKKYEKIVRHLPNSARFNYINLSKESSSTKHSVPVKKRDFERLLQDRKVPSHLKEVILKTCCF